MWAIRRASVHLRNRGLSSGTNRIGFVKSEIASCYLDNYNAGIIESQGKVLDALVYSGRFYNKSSSVKSHVEARTFSSQAGGVKSCGEQDDASEDASSELERRHDAVQEDASGDVIGDESICESGLSEGESIADDLQNELESLGSETDVGEKKSPKIKAPSAMAKAILAAPALPVSEVLGKWVKAGNEVTRGEILSTMLYLRKMRIFVKALELSEWSDSTKHLEFSDNHYASHVDLIARVRGIFKAEDYIRQIPESFRSEKVYRNLLASFAAATNVKKTELFNKMKKLFPITCFSCNQLLLLYKRTDRKKIAHVLLLMEKENIKPSVFTYKILIDVKGQTNDISQMEQIVETMKYEGVEPNMRIQGSLARHYAAAGLKDKAEAVLKEMEGSDITKNLWVCRVLLPIYASLGRDDEVGRIWKLCESNPQTTDCIAAIEAWGQLKRIEDAEAVFDTMLKKLKRPSSRHYAALLNVYANHKMLAKGKDLVRRMAESGITVLPVVWDALVKLFAGAGEVEKADSILEKALEQHRGKPHVNSYLTILDQYSKRGDVDNAERIFLKMREAGFTSRLRPYRSLLYAYVNAKTPAYGFDERMKADNILPTKALADLLARASPFRASEVAIGQGAGVTEA